MNNSQISNVLKILEEDVRSYSAPVVDLIQVQTKDPFKVLVAALLSARTTDQTTTTVLRNLFKRVHSADDLNGLTTSQIEKLIYPVGFYRNKATYLKKLPQVLREKFNGNVPDRIEELIKLPGVGRKTANLVRTVAFGKPAICVDVHVHRIMNRMGYIRTKTPLESEMALREKLPKKHWGKVNYLLVAHGQNVCRPISPHCSSCHLRDLCQRKNVSASR